MNSSKSKKILVYVIMGLLSLAGIYSEIVICIHEYSFPLMAETVVTCIMFGLIACYAISYYKTPHGNLLKYLFLVFAVMCFSGLINSDPNGSFSQGTWYAYQIARGAVVILSTYIAGRLDRIKQNTVLAVICAVLLLATSIECIIVIGNTSSLSFILFESNFFIMWLDLMIAYLFRYHGHKEAGLADK